VKIKVMIAAMTMTVAFQFRLHSQAAASVWDGAYTNEQAKRGEPIYGKECASCHGDALDGVGQAPALAGDDFKANWNGQTVGDLFEKIQATMPAGSPGTLSRLQNAAIVAFILKSNGFPAGAKELPTDPEPLAKIRIEPAKHKR
jgi:mono/diheme cytochrome c family protein